MTRIVTLLAAIVAASIGGVAAQAGTMHQHGHHNVTGLSGGPGFHGGVLAGPLYNGQDYRSYLLRDLGSRYGGGR